MFTGRYEPIPGSGQLTTPTTGESMVSTFKADYLAPFLLIPGMEKDKRKKLGERVGALRLQSESPLGDQGLGQRSASWLAGMAGSILNPLSLLGGEAGALIARPLISKGAGLLGRYLPSQATATLSRPLSQLVGNRLPKFVGKESIASLTGKAISGFAQGTGFSLPFEIANTYNPKSDMFDWQHGITASFADGGIALALMSTPYLAGIIWGKFFRGSADHVKMPLAGERPSIVTAEKTELVTDAHIDDAVKKGWLTSHEGQWFKDYIARLDTNENLSKRATEILIRDKHPVDSATNKVMFKVLGPDDVNNFQVAVGDSLANKLPDNVKWLYQEFIGRNRMDNLRENPSMIDGLKGVVSFVRKRLEKAPEEIVNFNKVMKRLLPNAIKEKNPLSQHRVYRGEKRATRTGVTVPAQVEERLKLDREIKRLNNQNKDLTKEFFRTGKKSHQKKILRNEEKILKLSEKVKPLLSHKEEMKHLREVLLPEGKVSENFKFKREYFRLLDLAKVRNDARRLVHEINLKHEYELHESFATMIDTITKVMRSEFGKLAKPENINDYMRERIQSRTPELRKLEVAAVKKEVQEAKQKIDETSKKVSTPEGQSNAIKVMDDEINSMAHSENKKEFELIRTQMNEFKKKEILFNKLIKCAIGK